MNISRAVPSAGLVALSLALGACGSDSDNNNSSSTAASAAAAAGAAGAATSADTAASTGTATGAATSAGTANTIDAIKAARTGAHEATSPELTTGYYATAAAAQTPNAPATAKALGAYGQVFAATGNTATNTRVQLRNLETYVRSAGKWTRVQFSHQVNGAFYAPGYAGDAQPCELGSCLRPESSGGVSVRMVNGKFFRFWPEAAFTQSLIQPAKVEAVFTTAQARLVQDNATATDDRASAKYLVNTAAAWAPATWTQSATASGATGAYDAALTDVGNGRLVLATKDWKAASFTTATDAQVDELGVAAAGGRAPIANSADTSDRVVRIMYIGDSITQGSAAQAGAEQDSFRRPLWNGLMTDPGQPQVDFVGTRTGTSVVDVNSCGDNSTAVDTGLYKLPEFDTAHQGYWGACTKQVTDVLPQALATLKAAARQQQPDVAVIHIGTNNLHNDAANGVANAITQLKAMIDVLRAGNDSISILVAKVIPYLNTEGGAEEPGVATYNAQLDTQIAPLSTAKSKVVLVDQHTGFATSMLRDRFHPNDQGEAVLADKWLAALKANNLLKN
ncbi:MAG: GDSL-type esterase/lipase family protein [Lautropia sp.]|nr:GDSL-type esterase/lipase family protein [Lautropia sp.]